MPGAPGPDLARAPRLEPMLFAVLTDSSRVMRRWVPLSRIPPILQQAVIASEDRRFRQHRASPPGQQQQRLPAAALVRHDGKTWAFVQTAGDDKAVSFAARQVHVVSQGGDSVMVDGIKAGERVAIKGVSGLKAMLTGVGKE